ncbi:MAG TPA: ABC transporter permease [Candidatus Binataceae bacterium]|nr:ABC transporter permease [Candidatus Binataceae bacterium]
MDGTVQATLPPGELSFARKDAATLVVRISGNWHMRHGLPSAAALLNELTAQPRPQKIAFDTSALGQWDSGLLAFLTGVSEVCRQNQVSPDLAGLPDGARKLLELAEAVPEKTGARAEVAQTSFVTSVGAATLSFWEGFSEFLTFFGEVTIAFGKLFEGKARFRRVDLMVLIQDCGANAFGIITLLSFLVGTILAFMGAVQLQQFGAAIYIADMVGIAMTHDMGAMMTAIIMAGRTGAAFAAQLGTMKVTQEIDALVTMGISPMEFLVLPRVIALCLMIPLLCLYSDFMGILGGGFVSATMMGIAPGVYMRETMHAVTMTSVIGGLVKSIVYGVIIAVAGCLRGFQCGNSSSAVGDAATQAVVTGIVYIVVACGIFAFLFNILGI